MDIDALIRSLEDFVPKSDDQDILELYDLLDGFEDLQDNVRALPALFALLERYPEQDFGSPGPIVHGIESIGVDLYINQLVSSVDRCPTELSIWMVNRILNVTPESPRRDTLLGILREVSDNKLLPDSVVESALDFLRHQCDRTGQ